MNALIQAINGPFLVQLPKIFFWLVFICAAALCILQSRYAYRLKFLGERSNKYLILITVAFDALFSGLQTAVQFYVWSFDSFSKTFLPPYQPRWYFMFATFQRFWLGFLIGIGAALVFYLFLQILKKYRERFFEKGEPELGFLMALLVGWPNFTLFLPLAFLCVIFIALARRVFLKEAYTTLGVPIMLAAGVLLLFGEELLRLFKLTVLKV